MFGSLRKQWSRFKKLPPGRRFRLRHEEVRRTGRSVGWRVAVWGGSLLLLAIGVVLVFIPGPAVLFFGLAGALLAGESRWIARGLDATEVKLRRAWVCGRRFCRRLPPVGKVALAGAAGLVGLAGVAGAAWLVFFRR